MTHDPLIMGRSWNLVSRKQSKSDLGLLAQSIPYMNPATNSNCETTIILAMNDTFSKS
jgi:hypothetical protein